MIRYTLVILFVISCYNSSVFAQNDDKVPHIWISIQANALTSFQVNSIERGGAYSQGIALSIADPDRYRFGIDLHLFRGFNSAIDFLYGGSIFYTLIQNDKIRVKSGLNISRFAVNDYKQEYEVLGGKIEDQFPETFNSYIALEWPMAKKILLTAKGGYRFIRSDLGTVVDIVERYPNGKPSRVSVSEKQKWYGSGFEFGLGLKIKVY